MTEPLTSAETAEHLEPKEYKKFLRTSSSYGSFHLDEDELDRPSSIFKTGYPIVCILFAIACSVMLIIEFWTNGWKMESMSVNPTVGVSVNTLLELGAKRGDLILAGQWYRLIAPMFLHAGVIHYAFNMFGLWQIGFPLEKQFGSLATFLILFVGGFEGVVWSAILSPATVSVGASGAVFALFGSGWSDLIHNWSLYHGRQWCVFFNLFFATAINLLIGLMPYLDNFAHIAGLLTGVLVGFGVLVANRYTRWGELKERKTYQIVLQVIAVIITPLLITASLLILYLGVEAEEWCSWCSYLSCVPFPPKNPWWTCDECSDYGVTAYYATSSILTVNCPSGQAVNTTAPSGLAENSALLIELCQEIC
eukprot:CAMPEP_0171492554 /NCGR_PEP_ID=MMETSP0958-20121227/4475_1 /TAXON_ID=87120 /ORGANISM="Aurantiochytrium limacinum, Strain ATCCMYA-1381" /LENGTH=364 /DNA_ID=CAMNT_0012026087 /DNA_START=796 /DNA_END=1890 /DNA_ORIENTATION=+